LAGVAGERLSLGPATLVRPTPLESIGGDAQAEERITAALQVADVAQLQMNQSAGARV